MDRALVGHRATVICGRSFHYQGPLQKGEVQSKSTRPSGVSLMIKVIFEAIEAMLRAVIYLLILLIGLALAALGAYTIVFLSIRIGQLLYELLFKEKWL